MGSKKNESRETAENAAVAAGEPDKVLALQAAENAAVAAREASDALKAAREAVKAAKAKVRELGQAPTCTSVAIETACRLLDCSTEEWTAAMAAAGYENGTLNKAAPAMLNQTRVICRHLRKYGHMPAKVENK